MQHGYRQSNTRLETQICCTSAGFHTAEAKGIWKEYTESYYQMDTYYRLFHLSFQKSLETSNILLDDLFKHVVDKVEGLYTHWFLGELGNNWSDVCADELAIYGKVLKVPQHRKSFTVPALRLRIPRYL